MKKHLIIYIIVFLTYTGWAQDSSNVSKKFTISGYIKDLQNLTFDRDFKNSISGNLVHNRLNLKWKPSVSITAIAEFRNRLFWGEEIKSIPDYGSLLKNDNSKIDLQKTWINNNALILHTNIERLYFEYRKPKWNVRIGRQRINWGIATTWNPNDIFNAYNFLDFDYEERPGVDGGKAEYIFNSSFNTELAFAYTGKDGATSAAIKSSFNKWNYDFQLITGWYDDHATIGAGWAGYIKDAGFKGEVQYFHGSLDSTNHFNLTIESDYMFKKGWYFNLGFLYNNQGLYKPVLNWDTIDLKISPQNLMPTKWNVIITSAKEFTPLCSGNMGILYAPGTNLLILLPSIQYNMASNFDLNLVWQSFFADINHHFGAVSHRAYLRAKWSF